MLRARLPAPLIGVLSFVLMLAALLFWGLLCFLPVAILRLLLPMPSVRTLLARRLERIGQAWVGTNQRIYTLMHAPRFQLHDVVDLDPDRSYLLVCNHQSWADILLLFDRFHGRVAFLRFFLKKELIWVPLIGFICWALDMPFMQRSSRKGTQLDPAARRRDLETTRRFCQKYRGQAITVVNFAEGTRCTEAKRQAQGQPYRHLLRPKAAGMSFTLKAMGDQFAGIIDVTLVYQPRGGNRLWSWLCGQQRDMAIHVCLREIPPAMITGDYEADPVFRATFKHWLETIWREKDARIDRVRSRLGAPAAEPREIA